MDGEWYQNSHLHREDGPATDGKVDYCYLDTRTDNRIWLVQHRPFHTNQSILVESPSFGVELAAKMQCPFVKP